MFRIYVNATLIDEVLGYHNALKKAKKIKENYILKGNQKVFIEDIKGRVIDTL